MSDIKNSSENQDVKNDDSPKKALSRRQFLVKGAVYSTPVIMTVAASPVLAHHCTVSGALSGNLSRVEDDHVCVGLTPGYWGTHPNEWPAQGYFAGNCVGLVKGPKCQNNDYDIDGTPFLESDTSTDLGMPIPSGTAKTGPFGGTLYRGYTMMQVIQMEGKDDKFQLGAHACAALLNAIKFSTDPYYNFGYTPEDIVDMYNDPSIDAEQLKINFQLLNERGF